jgi:hypothetical protein
MKEGDRHKQSAARSRGARKEIPQGRWVSLGRLRREQSSDYANDNRNHVDGPCPPWREPPPVLWYVDAHGAPCSRIET